MSGMRKFSEGQDKETCKKMYINRRKLLLAGHVLRLNITASEKIHGMVTFLYEERERSLKEYVTKKLWKI